MEIERLLPENPDRLPFLLIGGHAVVLHGHLRNTADVDLLIPESSLNAWKAFLEEAGYRLLHQNAAFAQFEGSAASQFPVDLMIVDDGTFGKLASVASIKELANRKVAVPAVAHLIALKLHAIRQPARRNTEKDWSDIIGLIRSCGADLEDGDFRALIDQYGGPGATSKIRELLGNGPESSGGGEGHRDSGSDESGGID